MGSWLGGTSCWVWLRNKPYHNSSHQNHIHLSVSFASSAEMLIKELWVCCSENVWFAKAMQNCPALICMVTEVGLEVESWKGWFTSLSHIPHAPIHHEHDLLCKPGSIAESQGRKNKMWFICYFVINMTKAVYSGLVFGGMQALSPKGITDNV